MAEGLREMLANRRFAIPLIALLALCFIGLLLIGFVIIFRPGENGEPVAQATSTATALPTDTSPTAAPSPTNSPTPSPTPTLVPTIGAVTEEETDQPAVTTEPDATDTGGEATVEPTTEEGAGDQETPTPEEGEDELAQTGVGWGLVLGSAVGLAALALVARRLRLAS
jgi:hypothetical protein